MNTCGNKSPWQAEKAFEPFFDEHISVEILTPNGTKRQSLPCCVFIDQMDVPVDSDMVSTERKTITITCRREDWCFVKLLKIGDIVKRSLNDRSYSVTEVDDELCQEIIIKARSC